jgi:hypothetical protein
VGDDNCSEMRQAGKEDVLDIDQTTYKADTWLFDSDVEKTTFRQKAKNSKQKPNQEHV